MKTGPMTVATKTKARTNSCIMGVSLGKVEQVLAARIVARG